MAGYQNHPTPLSRLPLTGLSFTFEAVDPDVFSSATVLMERLIRAAILSSTEPSNTAISDEVQPPEPEWGESILNRARRPITLAQITTEEVHLYNLRQRRFERWLITHLGE